MSYFHNSKWPLVSEQERPAGCTPTNTKRIVTTTTHFKHFQTSPEEITVLLLYTLNCFESQKANYTGKLNQHTHESNGD